MVIAERPEFRGIVSPSKTGVPRVLIDWGEVLQLSPEDRKKIGANVRDIRVKKGIGQRDFFTGPGGQSRQSRIELGKFSLTMPLLERESLILGVPIEKFFKPHFGGVREVQQGSPRKLTNLVRVTDEMRAMMLAARSEKGLRQSAVLGSKRQSTYSGIERGDVLTPSRRIVAEIEDKLGIDLGLPKVATKTPVYIKKKAEPITIWRAPSPKPQVIVEKTEPVKDEPVPDKDVTKFRTLNGLMARVASLLKPGIKPPHFMDGDVQIDFSLGDRHQSSPHFHMAGFPIDARSAGEVHEYETVILAMRTWLKPQLRSKTV